jgi:hypothetical protein
MRFVLCFACLLVACGSSDDALSEDASDDEVIADAGQHALDGASAPAEPPRDASRAEQPARDAAPPPLDSYVPPAPVDSAVAPVDASNPVADAGAADAGWQPSGTGCARVNARYVGTFSGVVTAADGGAEPALPEGKVSFAIARFPSEPLSLSTASFSINTINPTYVSTTATGSFLETSPDLLSNGKLRGEYRAADGRRLSIDGGIAGGCTSESAMAGTWSFETGYMVGISAHGTWSAQETDGGI